MDLEYINVSELSDMEVASRMRKCNYEKFKTLVRMHLSFELDLNTDEFDLPCHEIVYEDKGKLKKWNRLSKKHKHHNCASTTGCTSATKCNSNTNSPSEGLLQIIDSGFMFHLTELKEFLLLEKNITQEGLFRKTGSISRQNELRHQMRHEKPLDLEEAGYSAHDCATVFKAYLADLSEPLLTDAHYPAHLQIAPLCIGSTIKGATASPAKCITKTETITTERQKREQHLLSSVQLLLLLLPEDNRELFEHIIDMLHKVAQHEYHNKMSATNLATLFAPHLICPRNLPPEALHYVARKMSSIIAYMIMKGLEIFEVPAKLSTDIRAYFLERKRKKTMSPEQMLDESISDMSTVNTVYTFVNREMTAEAHNTNTTETELAQLYAHIQSLPESSRKRRLIKQFNKQNGQGTPLQVVALNRLKDNEITSRSGKSLGDAIKKRIFQKAIMSRTPKRPAPSTLTMPSIETPNASHNKNPKMRVLFQSPAPNKSPTSYSKLDNTTLTNASACTNLSSLTTTTSLATLNTAVINTPLYSKSQTTLQKSISSISLLQSSTKRTLLNQAFLVDESQSSNNTSASSLSDNGNNLKKTANGFSISAPVSRQASNELDSIHDNAANTSGQQLTDTNCCVASLKLITDAAKLLISNGAGSTNAESVPHGINATHIGEKKSVAWEEQKLYDIDEYSNACTPLKQQPTSGSDMKSRYKSEPNLSRILTEKNIAANDAVPTTVHSNNIKACSKSLTRKLIKGVSMGNLKFPFSTPDTTKRLVRSVSTTLKKHTSNEQAHSKDATHMAEHTDGNDALEMPLFQHLEESDLDDDTFEDDPNDHIDDDDDEDEVDTKDNIEKKRNDNDEDFVNAHMRSILLPVINTELSSDDANSNSSDLPGCSMTTSYQHLLLQQSGLYRNLNLITSTPSLLLGRRSMSPITKSTQRMPKYMQESIMTPRSRKPVMVLAAPALVEKNCNEHDNSGFVEEKEQPAHEVNEPNMIEDLEIPNEALQRSNDDSLTKNFKNYLFKRSVCTGSPVDSSFSSQPDDFIGDDDTDTGSNDSRDFDNLNESKLSPSLLFCLDGNKPDDVDDDGSNATAVPYKLLNITADEAAENFKSNSASSANNTSESSVTPNGSYEVAMAQTLLSSIDEDKHEQAEAEQHMIIGNQNNRINRLSTNPFIILNNARKRAATNELDKHPQIFMNNKAMSTAHTHTQTQQSTSILTISKNNIINKTTAVSLLGTSNDKATAATALNCEDALTVAYKPSNVKSMNKENQTQAEGYLLTKKLLISEYPGETNF